VPRRSRFAPEIFSSSIRREPVARSVFAPQGALVDDGTLPATAQVDDIVKRLRWVDGAEPNGARRVGIL